MNFPFVVADGASLDSDVESARHDKSLALRKGLALWVVGRDSEAAAWLEHSNATSW